MLTATFEVIIHIAALSGLALIAVILFVKLFLKPAANSYILWAANDYRNKSGCGLQGVESILKSVCTLHK